MALRQDGDHALGPGADRGSAGPEWQFLAEDRAGQLRLTQVDDMILSLYARGMTTRDIKAHLAEVYGAHVSAELISKVTEVVREEIIAWQTGRSIGSM